MTQADYLLSSLQLDHFRQGKGVATETEVRGRRGAYFTHATIELPGKAEYTWRLFADVDQDNADVIQTIEAITQAIKPLCSGISRSDIAANQSNLWKIVAGADGLQLSNEPLCTAHHYANTMFNVMRGGTFIDQYWVTKTDFIEFLSGHNHSVLNENADFISDLPDKFQISELLRRADGASGSTSLTRLSRSYLPLTFSRRHGDPSRPWNWFSIKIKNSDGSRRLDYEGNWRDIFQNWEALAHSFPEFIENMISHFSECHHGRWIQPVSDCLSRGRLGSSRTQ